LNAAYTSGRMLARPPIVVLGAGLTGLGAARHLPAGSFRIVERAPRAGGHAVTVEDQGFRFDRTGHLLHLRDPGIRTLVEELLAGELLAIERRSRVWSHGVYTEYPFQANTWGLPRDVALECVAGFVHARERARQAPPASFDDFIRRHFGEGIARHFMVPYNTKIWGVPPSEMTAEWCDRFVPVPSLEEVLDGAIGPPRTALGYNARFLYPRRGIGALPEALARGVPVELSCEPIAIDPTARSVTIAGGEVIPWKALVATIPLPNVVGLCGASAPPEVRAAAGRLRCTGLHYLDVALSRPVPTDVHWVYVPEARWPFYRVGVYTNFSPELAPPGRASLYVELASRETPDLATLVPEVARGLVAMGLVASAGDVSFVRARRLEWAYVVYDRAWSEARRVVLDWLDRQHVVCAGRYGAWNYSSMEDALLMGRDAAARAIAIADG
jgi:protoporphyrinogen oxidase